MDNEELERTNLMKTMLIEVDEEESIDENIEQFEEKLEYLDIPEEKKQKLQQLCNEIKKEDNENSKEYLFKLLQKEATK